ncbi:hypothetical protein MMC18_006081 [Xylographa bjoerkii]|nr:hypothetical protein [Xylographa bjoerkii]
MKGVYLGWDDLWIFIALFFAYGNGIAEIVGVVYAGVGQHAADLSTFQVAAAKQCLLAAEMTWVMCTTSIKLSILCLFVRLFPIRRVRIEAYILIGIVTTFCLAALLAFLLQCRPIQANWDPTIEAVCGNQAASWLGTGITNILTDVMVLALPIPSVWNLKLPRVTKIGLIGIFGVGFLVCIISILRIISIFSISLADITYTKVPTDIYSILEPSLGIICACLPILRPIFDRILPASLLHSHPATSRRASHPAFKAIASAGAAKPYSKGGAADEGFLGLKSEAGLFGMEDVRRETTVVAGLKGDAETESTPRGLESGINVTREWEVERGE